MFFDCVYGSLAQDQLTVWDIPLLKQAINCIRNQTANLQDN